MTEHVRVALSPALTTSSSSGWVEICGGTVTGSHRVTILLQCCYSVVTVLLQDRSYQYYCPVSLLSLTHHHNPSHLSVYYRTIARATSKNMTQQFVPCIFVDLKYLHYRSVPCYNFTKLCLPLRLRLIPPIKITLCTQHQLI